MSSNLLHRSLDDIDVREAESDITVVDGNPIEFSTFVEGEYVESILISRVRATEVYRNLGKLLGQAPPACEARAGVSEEGDIWRQSSRAGLPSKLADNGNSRDAASYSYRIAWCIDLEAASAHEAAAKARRIQLNPESIATVFEVQRRDGTTVCVDAEL